MGVVPLLSTTRWLAGRVGDTRQGRTALRQGVWLLVVAIASSGVMMALASCGGGAAQPAGTPAAAGGDTVQTQTQRVPVEAGGSYQDVSAAGLASMLKAKDFPLINVHIPYEGEIEPTDQFIPYNEIEQHLSGLPADRAAKIVLYCRSGSMSAIAARALVRLGYTNVYNLDGGMIAWKNAGYPLADKKR